VKRSAAGSRCDDFGGSVHVVQLRHHGCPATRAPRLQLNQVHTGYKTSLTTDISSGAASTGSTTRGRRLRLGLTVIRTAAGLGVGLRVKLVDKLTC